jgi:DNA-binding CsgD family transcriptional regulator
LGIKILNFPFILIFLCSFSSLKNYGSNLNDNKKSYSLFYCKDNNDLNIQNINSQKFREFPKSKSLGFRNGVYWIKLQINKSKKDQDLIAYLPTHNINKIEIYKSINNRLVYESSVGNSILRPELKVDYKYPAFNIKTNNNENVVYYLRVDFPKEVNFPIKIIQEKKFIEYIIEKNSFNNLYYGTCFIILLLNIFFFIKFKEITYLFYSLFLTSLSFNFLLFDGSLIDYYRGDSNYYYLELIIHFFNEIWFLFFSLSFLSIHKKYPKFYKLAFVFPVLVILFYFAYASTKNYLFIVIADTIGITLLPLLWFVGILNLKKIPHASFYVFGYLLLIPFSVYFIVGYPFGLWEVRGDMKIIKIASWLDIIVFTYAISYRMKSKIEDVSKNALELENYISQSLQKIEVNKTSSDPFLILLKENKILNKPLTLREVEVLRYLDKGFTNNIISEKLFISPNTLKSHIRNIYLKTNVKSRKELKEKIKQINT